MAWSVLQSNKTAATASSGTSVSTAFTSNLSAGSTIIAAFSAAASSTAPTTPTAKCGGVSMVLLAQGTSTGGTGSQTLTALFALNTPAGQVGTQPTVQGQWNNAAFTSQVIEEVSGLITSTTQAGFTDGSPAVKVNASGTNPATSAAYSSTASNEFLIFVYGDDGGPATLGTLSTGYTTDTNNVSGNSHSDLGIGYKNSGNTAESASWALTGSLAGQVTILTAIQLAPAAPGSSMLPQPGGQTWRRRYRKHQAWPAGANPPITSTGSLNLNMAMAGTGYQGVPFPRAPLGIKVELLINGTWTDITTFVYQRADMVITTGRPDESQQLQQSSCTFVLNNQDFRFSPYATSGAYYPYLTRNTQCRVSVTAISASGTLYSGYRFWGEVPAWPPGWDTTGTDLYVTVTASGIMRRLTANTRNIGSALYRYYSRLSGAAAPVAYWPCTDMSGSTSFASAVSGGTAMTWTGTPSLNSDTSIAGSDGFAQYSGSAWTGNVSGGGPLPSPATYQTPGTYLWECPGDVTSLTSAEAWGAGSGASGGSANFGFLGGGGGAYAKITSVAVTPGTQYTVVVGAGGAGTSDLSTSGNGASSTATFDSATVTAVGGVAPVGNTVGQGGRASASTGTTKHSGGNGGVATQAGGAGGGSSAGTGSDGNTGGGSSSNSGASGGSAPSGGGKGGAGGNISTAGGAGAVPGGGAGGAGGGGTGTAYSGGNGGAGEVKLTYTSSGAPAANILRFCLDVPAAGGVNGSIYGEMLTTGTIATVDVTYGTGGTLTVTGYNSGHVSKFTHTSGNICNGVPMMVQVSLTQSGTSVAWSFDYVTVGAGSSTNIASGTVTSSTVGGVLAFNGNPGGTETGSVGVGEVTIQYAADAGLSGMGAVIAAYAGERAATRLARLCSEANVGFELTGNASDTAQMGPQTDEPITNLFQECEDVDKGLLYEPRDMFGLGYRTRVSLQNQSPGATLDYAAYEVGEAVPQPVDDELLVANDITLTRTNGSSFESTLTSGALSVLDPPNGVGYYSQQYTYNLFADSQLANAAAWALTIGTVDEFRWPVIEADLRRSALAGATFAAVPGLFIGSFLEVVNPPAFVLGSAVKQLVYGFTETLNAFNWTFDFNCVPESPYEGVGLPSW